MDDTETEANHVEQETMLTWLETYWNDLAAFAWRNYVESGRGLVLLQGDWGGEVAAGYQTPTMAVDAGQPWPDELVDAVRAYNPHTDIVFLVHQGSEGTVLAMTTIAGRQPPHLAGIEDDVPPLVPSA